MNFKIKKNKYIMLLYLFYIPAEKGKLNKILQLKSRQTRQIQ